MIEDLIGAKRLFSGGSISILISAIQLSKSFGSKTLFQDISFSIEAKAKIGLIGPNGAGKSTMMKILCGQMSPDSGQVVRSQNLRIGFLEQNPNLPSDVRVADAICGQNFDDLDSADSTWGYEIMSRFELDGDKVNMETPIQSLSEGWKKRVAMAAAFYKHPDLLVLDEPTNHLDIHSIAWLEEFLRKQNNMAVLVVTHDRLFLQNVCNQIFDLNPKLPQRLLKTNGTYAQHLESKQMLLDSLLRQEEVKKNTLRTELDWLRRSPSARQTKQKARQERAIDLIDDVRDLKSRNLNRKVGIDFGETQLRNQKLIQAEEITLSVDGRDLVKNLTLLVRASSRVALLGRNGCGKSTLIRTLIGERVPDGGHIRRYDDLKVAYFEQKKDSLDMEQTLLRSVCPEGDYVIFQGKPVFAKSYLSRFHFRGDQMDLKVKYLSGGEKSRILIARLMLQDCHLLILDEPTNDLDIETLDVLEECLESFSGAVILVSHNRHFMDQVCDEIYYFTEQNGEMIRFQGYFQWEEWNSQKPQATVQKVEPAPVVVAPVSPPPAKKKGKLSYKEQIEFDQMESVIAKEEEKLASMQTEIASEETAKDYKRLNQLMEEISTQELQVKKLYQRWQDLERKSSGVV